MIFAHSIIGVLPIDNNSFSWCWFLGSVIPDLDHVFVLCKHKIFSWSKLVDSLRFEDKYKLHFKTKYMHSVGGALVLSAPLFFVDTKAGLYFFGAYILHLLLDWPDRDEKLFFYPFSKRVFRGWLPIFSNPEKVSTLIILVILFFSYF